MRAVPPGVPAAPRAARAVSARALGGSLAGWPIWASIAAHGAALAAASTVAAWHPASPPPDAVPIEVVRIEDPPPPVPARREPTKPPKVVTRTEPLTPPSPITEPRPEPIPPSPPAPALRTDAPRRDGAPPVAEPADAGGRFLAGASSSSFALSGSPGGGAGSSGTLFATGDLPIPGRTGGTGQGPGAGGEGSGSDGSRQVASRANPTGLTSFARPAGGYQTRPRYPDSARRQGIEGETLLRFQVLPTGRVTSVTVARSAGHPDLDRSAVEAVQTWLFEPARRGKEAVAVWVTLPVRFQLQRGVGE